MMLDFITAGGAVLPLAKNSRFKLLNVDELTSAKVDISSSTIAGMDGDIVNSTRLIPRTIPLFLSIEKDVEDTKRYIFKYIKPKQQGILQLTQKGRITRMAGIVENISMPRFKNLVIMQVSLYCSNPLWEDIEPIVQDIAEEIPMHYFTNEADDMLYFPEEGIVFDYYDENRTRVFVNDGDDSVGLQINIIATGNVNNPVMYNSKGEYIGVNVDMVAGDEVIISTIKGHKAITLNGVNIISKIRAGSKWLQLPTGEEEFTIDSEDGTEKNMYFTITYKQRYV